MYFPKSQINPNQYTNGGEFSISSTGEIYKGPYFSTSMGEFYTGKTPNSPNPLKLSPLGEESGNSLQTHSHSDSYNVYIRQDLYYNARNIKGRNISPRDPLSTIPSNPKENFTRYFASKTNEITFIEISKNEYDKLKNKNSEVNWTLYEPIKIEWMVEGTREEVYLKNKSSVLQVGILGFEQYFREKYDKFWLG